MAAAATTATKAKAAAASGVTKSAVPGARFVSARERSDKEKVAATLASVTGKGPAAATITGNRAGSPGVGEPEGSEEGRALDAAAGSHPGLVPFMVAMVGLVKTGQPLLELRGARGMARTCFAAARGAPTPVALLQQAKATAAEAGAVGALTELLRWEWLWESCKKQSSAGRHHMTDIGIEITKGSLC
jgi:hypothetical protein